jgi:hypothetical protein
VTVCVCVSGFNVQSVFDRKSKRVPTVQIKDKAHYLTRTRLCGLLEENFSLYAFTSGKPFVYSFSWTHTAQLSMIEGQNISNVVVTYVTS